jgi:hypothetical protein
LKIFAAIAKEFSAIFHQREIFLLPSFSFDLSKEKRTTNFPNT